MISFHDFHFVQFIYKSERGKELPAVPATEVDICGMVIKGLLPPPLRLSSFPPVSQAFPIASRCSIKMCDWCPKTITWLLLYSWPGVQEIHLHRVYVFPKAPSQTSFILIHKIRRLRNGTLHSNDDSAFKYCNNIFSLNVIAHVANTIFNNDIYPLKESYHFKNHFDCCCIWWSSIWVLYSPSITDEFSDLKKSLTNVLIFKGHHDKKKK